MTEIFKMKICLPPELVSDIFENIKKAYFQWVNLQFRPEDPSDKKWHRNRKISHRIFFQMNVNLSTNLWMLREKQKLRLKRTVLESYAKHIFTKYVSFNFPKWWFFMNAIKKLIFALLYKLQFFLIFAWL